MPLTGGAVLAANHLSAIDPPAIGVYSTRAIRYMTKVELLQLPLAGEFLRMTGTFAVRRGEGDRDSLRVARWLAREGHVVGMFMEGTRQKFGYPGPAHSGRGDGGDAGGRAGRARSASTRSAGRCATAGRSRSHSASRWI